MIIRKYEPSDCKCLAKLFYDTVHTVNAKNYTEEQLEAWAPKNMDLAAWNQSFLQHHTVIAVYDNRVAGFGDMDETGYLDRLYVHKDYQNKGIGTAICSRLERDFKGREITTQASITAKPFFMSKGYQVIKEQQVARHGILLANTVMEKVL